jgi:glycosyltransferase involved in cell wall biosynthesis
MKILMFSYLPPVLSGVANYTLSLCKELMKKGHEVEIVSFHDKNMGEYAHEGIKVHGFPSFFNLVDMYALDAMLNLQDVLKLVRKIKPDIIHFHHRTSNIEFAMGAIKKEARCAVVNTVHSAVGSLETFDLRDALHFIHYKMLSGEFKNHSDMVMAVSQFNKDHLVANGVPEDRVKVIRNGTFVEKFEGVNREDARKRLGLSEKDKVVLFVGRHLPEKGLDFLIPAFNLLSKKNKNTKLVIVGEDALTFIYKQLASSNKNILFPGRVPNNSLIDYYKASDMLVLPSVWHEPQATVLYEAMAAKLPIVATSTGGTTELIKECESGILVEPRSVDALFNGMNTLLDDEDLMRKSGANGHQKVVNNYTWDKISDAVVSVYNSVKK